MPAPALARISCRTNTPVSTDTKVSSIPSSDVSQTAHSGVIRSRRTAQGAYAVANLSYPLGRSVQIGAQVNNLFDRTYYTRLGRCRSHWLRGRRGQCALRADDGAYDVDAVSDRQRRQAVSSSQVAPLALPPTPRRAGLRPSRRRLSRHPRCPAPSSAMSPTSSGSRLSDRPQPSSTRSASRVSR